MDTTAQRWAMLEPHIRHVGPDDDRTGRAISDNSDNSDTVFFRPRV